MTPIMWALVPFSSFAAQQFGAMHSKDEGGDTKMYVDASCAIASLGGQGNEPESGAEELENVASLDDGAKGGGG
jgi:hypothetical protein